MNRYVVVTSFDEKVGHVVGETESSLIVESGHLRKTQHAIPKAFANVNDADETVCVTVTKDVIEESPKVNGGTPDEGEVARHYGLAAGFEAPDTQGEGEVLPDDPAFGDAGARATEQERVEIRQATSEDAPDEEVVKQRTRPGV